MTVCTAACIRFRQGVRNGQFETNGEYGGGEFLEPNAILPAYMTELKTQDKIRVLSHDEQRIVYQIDCVDGTGTVEVLTLFPGIVLQFHSFHCRSFRLSESKEMGNSLKINFCTEGRMEVRMSDNLFLFMEPGNLSIDVRKAQDSFQFPCGHYHGTELLIHASAGSHETPEILRLLGVDGKQVQDRFCRNAQSYVVRADERFRKLFEDIGSAPSECRIPYLQMKAAELLLLLCATEMPEKSDESSFMTMGQVQIAKQIMEIISADLSKHYSIEKLAVPFGISASSLKNYFQGVYGKPVSIWLREARMSAAAHSLRESNRPVAEIAASVGYENASKFSAAFKTFLGESPLEYRRQSRCGM